ncbi:MAG TPA: ABC transporter ATP-binding protein/permease [Methylomirabilota bacterium]|nr:ABC transporter ATP-binding protein/permease [Methylomirabilota bacterium]
MSRMRSLFRDAWTIARPYWFSEDRWRGLALLAAVVGLNLGIVFINVLLNQWNNAFYNSLQDKDYGEFTRQLGKFTYLAALYIALAVYQLYLNQMLQIRWRRWLTDRYLATWLHDKAYYRMQLHETETDNPDQRIAEDLRLFVSITVGLGLGILRAVVTLVSFVAILWTLSGPLTIPGLGVTVPGYMVWAALLYAIVGTWLTDRIGRPLVTMNFDQQRYEADFRFSLVRFRENTEGVALYRGEADELRGFRERFGHVVRNWWDIMRQTKRLTSFTAGYAQVAIIFPFVVASPRYFRGEFALGGLMQTASAFGQVQDSLSYIVSTYTDIASWRAVVARLGGFNRALEQVRAEAAVQGIRLEPAGGAGLDVEQVHLALPDGRPLLDDVSFTLRRGDTALISGPSGAGKSTLFRAIAGIWPFGRGRVRFPEGERVLFLPQKPYLPLGTIREVVTYPGLPGDVSDAALVDALDAVGLPALTDRLDESANWALRLSPGEQQRIAFARALVQKPDWLFLDEATSAIDEDQEQRLYALLRQRLPGVTLLSVGHRSTLRAFHARRLSVAAGEAGNGAGAARLVETPSTA